MENMNLNREPRCAIAERGSEWPRIDTRHGKWSRMKSTQINIGLVWFNCLSMMWLKLVYCLAIGLWNRTPWRIVTGIGILLTRPMVGQSRVLVPCILTHLPLVLTSIGIILVVDWSMIDGLPLEMADRHRTGGIVMNWWIGALFQVWWLTVWPVKSSSAETNSGSQ